MFSLPNRVFQILMLAPLLTSHAVGASDYPSKPIRLIVSTTAGSLPDQVARWLSAELSPRLSQPIVVDNRPGASGSIGLSALASAPADGYTIGLQTLPWLLGPALLTSVAYDPTRDFTPVAMLTWSYNLVVIPSSGIANTVTDVIAKAKESPETVKFSSPGNGTPAHLILSLLQHQAGVTMTHVPYVGGPASLAAVVKGETDISTTSVREAQPLVQAGRIRVLATAAPRRLASHPTTPTLKELGYAGVELSDWQGVIAPRGTPKDVIQRLEAEITALLARADTRTRLESMGIEPALLDSEKFATHIATETERWTRVLRAAGIKAQ
jgi:tripartite-type tricarboxylate transporter receptor subunit TctC